MNQASAPETAAAAVNALADRFWEALLEESPTMATVYGDDRFDDRWEDPSPAGRATLRALRESVLAEARAIPSDDLPVEERITRDMLMVICEQAIAQDDLRMDQLAVVDQINGVQSLLPQLVSFQRADTPERLEKFLARIAGYGTLVDATIGVIEEGLAAGTTAARVVTERTIAQIDRLLAIPVAEQPAVTGAQLADGDDAGRARVAAAVEAHALPALGRLRAVLGGDYLAQSREIPGLWSAPDGEARYRAAILAWTTLPLDPAEVHQVGLDELASIKAEQLTIARRAGFETVDAYRDSLRADPANAFESKEALVSRAKEDVARAFERAPQWFGRLPVAECDVRAVDPFMEADAPFAYYYPPTVDRSRPGIYFVNTYDLPSRFASTLATTTYHEAVPGHHFQIALELEHPSLPVFRRLGARMVGASFAEGWGLYSERLADEMGLFRNEQERFGMLGAQAWRAARLVVDTGLHALRKDREWAVATLLDAGLTETDAAIETDRYIVWPGQALSYKIGQREIESLRAQLTRRDGAAFDIRRFHDELIGHGTLPLATLRRELPNWVTAGEA